MTFFAWDRVLTIPDNRPASSDKWSALYDYSFGRQLFSGSVSCGYKIQVIACILIACSDSLPFPPRISTLKLKGAPV